MPPKKVTEIPTRDAAILRTVFTAAFGAVLVWAGGRLTATIGLQESSNQLTERRNSELAIMNQRIASLEEYVRDNCRSVQK